jgi:hypothetical protein
LKRIERLPISVPDINCGKEIPFFCAKRGEELANQKEEKREGKKRKGEYGQKIKSYQVLTGPSMASPRNVWFCHLNGWPS